MNDSTTFFQNLSLGLLTALVGVLFIGSQLSQINKSLVITTFVFLFLSLFLNYRKGHRQSLRSKIFNSKLKKLLEESIETSMTAVYQLSRQTVSDIKDTFFTEHASLINRKTDDEIKFYLKLYIEGKNLSLDNDKTASSLKDLIIDGVNHRISKIRQESFSHPLDENFSKFNYYLDVVAFRFAYYFFFIAMVSFIITSITIIIQI